MIDLYVQKTLQYAMPDLNRNLFSGIYFHCKTKGNVVCNRNFRLKLPVKKQKEPLLIIFCQLAEG